MGEIADMMLDGTLCEGCGVYIEGEAEGFPRYCSDECTAGRGVSLVDCTDKRPEKTNCPTCNKRVKLVGLFQHRRDVHGWKADRATSEVPGAQQ